MNSPSDASLLAWLRLQQPPSSLAACASLSDLSDGVALAAAFNALAPPHLATICAEEPVARLEALSAVLSSQCAQLGLSVALQLEEPRVALAQGRTTTLTRRLVEALLGYAVHGDQREEVVGRILQMDAAHQSALMLRIEQQLATPRARPAAAPPPETPPPPPLPRSVSPGRGDSPGRNYTAVRKQVGELTDELTEARARCETLEAENDRLRAARDALSGELRGKVEEVHRLRFRAATAEAEAAEGFDAGATAEALRRELATRDAELRELRATAEPAAAAAAAALGEERRLREAEAAKLRDARDALKREGREQARLVRELEEWKVRCERQDLEIEALRERAALTARKGSGGGGAPSDAAAAGGGGGALAGLLEQLEATAAAAASASPRQPGADAATATAGAPSTGAAAVQAAAPSASGGGGAALASLEAKLKRQTDYLRLAKEKLLAQQREIEQLRARVASDAPPTSNEVQILHETLGQRDQELKALIAMKEEGEAQLRDEQRLVATAFYELSLECARLRGE